MISCTRRIEWDAMHRIPRHESVCKAYHGHRYSADITCTAPLDELGRVVDFGVIRDRVGRLDPGTLGPHGDPHGGRSRSVGRRRRGSERPQRQARVLDARAPDGENLAAELGRVAGELLADTGVTVTAVRVWETPNCYADWTAS
jgi:6-pyruvoyltetrahydropterin/6-carboxytetrahydropterin synthase